MELWSTTISGSISSSPYTSSPFLTLYVILYVIVNFPFNFSMISRLEKLKNKTKIKLTSAALICTIQSDPDCVYTVYVRIGSIFSGGIDSIVSLTLSDENGWGIRISDLESWIFSRELVLVWILRLILERHCGGRKTTRRREF